MPAASCLTGLAPLGRMLRCLQRATLPPSVLYLIQRLTADADVGAAAAMASMLMTVPALASVLDAPTIAALHGAPFWEPLLRRVLAQFRYATPKLERARARDWRPERSHS